MFAFTNVGVQGRHKIGEAGSVLPVLHGNSGLCFWFNGKHCYLCIQDLVKTGDFGSVGGRKFFKKKRFPWRSAAVAAEVRKLVCICSALKGESRYVASGETSKWFLVKEALGKTPQTHQTSEMSEQPRLCAILDCLV